MFCMIFAWVNFLQFFSWFSSDEKVMKFYSWKNVANHCFNHEHTSVNMGKPGRIILPYRRANQQLMMHFEFGNKWSSSCVCLFLFRLMSSAQGKAKCAYIDWLMTVKLIFFVVMKEWPEFLNTFDKEVQIVYGLFLVNC